jgi:ribosomal protein S18 acetylase RimI-like enzyme
MTTQVALRSSQPSDDDFLCQLFADSHPELSSLPLPPPALDQLLQLQRQAQLSQYQARYPDAVDQVIEVDGRPAGRCWVHHGTDEHRLLDIAVLSSEQGRGTGRTVLHGLCRQAEQAGVPLRLTVWLDNAGARRLYTSLGFSSEAEADGYLSMTWTAAAGPASARSQGG